MAWPNKVYVATSALGVYYTEDFAVDIGQPTWTAVNDGLASTELRQFMADPFDAEGKQYALLNDKSALYLRSSGAAWATILTAAEANALVGETGGVLHSFDVDPTIEGLIWVFYGATTYGAEPKYYSALRSDDGGTSWVEAGIIFSSAYYTYEGGWILGRGDHVWATYRGLARGSGRLSYSSNSGASWTRSADYGVGDGLYRLFWHEDEPDTAYTGGLSKITSAGVKTPLDGSTPTGMWFDLDDPDHMRLTHVVGTSSNQLQVTDDSWTSYSTAGNTTPRLGGMISSWATQATDELIVGLLNTEAHAVATMSGEADATPSGRAGANVSTPPYTDSIPETRGSVVGIAAIIAISSEGPTPPPGSAITPPDKPGEAPSTQITLGGDVLTQAVTMPDYDGDDRGEPIQGDRGAWDSRFYPARHARDIANETWQYHTNPADPPLTNAYLDAVLRGLLWIEVDAGENLGAGDLVNLYDDSGELARLADATLMREAHGYVLSAVTAGNAATVMLVGVNDELVALTPGAKLYLGDAGAVTETAPTVGIVQEVGVAASATEMTFAPKHSIVLAT